MESFASQACLDDSDRGAGEMVSTYLMTSRVVVGPHVFLSVSVVVNTLDRAESLRRTLRAFETLRYPNFELIVVHGPCSDGTTDVLVGYEDIIRIGTCPEANLARSRNIGLAMAQGDIVAFIDDDAVPEPDWLDRLIEEFRDPLVGSVGGFIRGADGVRYQHEIVIADRFGDATYKRFGDVSTHAGTYISPTGTNVAMRRNLLLEIGGFDEEFAYFLDETDVNLRLADCGYRLTLTPAAEVHHKFAASHIRGTARKPLSSYLIARSKAYFCWVNATKTASPQEIQRHLGRYAHRQRTKWLRSVRTGRITQADATRLVDELDRGLVAGTHDAKTQAARHLLTAATVSEHKRSTYKLFRRKTLVDQSLRIAFLLPSVDAWPSCEAVLTTLSAYGHEITIIRSTNNRAKKVEFEEGIWIHDIPEGFLRRNFRWIGRSRIGHVKQCSAAFAEEIVRIQPRRQFHIICGPPLPENVNCSTILTDTCLFRVGLDVSSTWYMTAFLLDAIPSRPKWLSFQKYLAKVICVIVSAAREMEGHDIRQVKLSAKQIEVMENQLSAFRERSQDFSKH